jgi:hypothetical protein
MAAFDYDGEAEPFPSRGMRGRPVGYRRFARAADAIRFAIEELPAQVLGGAWLEVSEERYDAAGIHSLYERAGYPLDRTSRPAMPGQTVQASSIGRLPGMGGTKTGTGSKTR